MKNLYIDIETFSSHDLLKCGVYKYTEAPDFEILLFGYSVDGGPVEVIDLASGEKLPDNIKTAIYDNDVIKWAHNASFERICISKSLNEDYYLEPSSWHCTMVWTAYLGLPLSLAAVGSVLGLNEQKMTAGKDLIRYFCTPCKPTKTNNGRSRNMPRDNIEKWITFVNYNRRDVEVELAIVDKLKKHPVPDFIWEEYRLDQEINDRGIKVDIQLVNNAISIDNATHQKLMGRMIELTGLDNPASIQQLQSWLQKQGIVTEKLDKKAVLDILKSATGAVKEVLELRLQIAKSSIKKYQAMANAVCADERCRGMFQFYGANRTGRWSGRIVQLQNLYRNSMTDLDEARELVKQGNLEALELLYPSVPDVLSQLVRTAFIPSKGNKFIVADFSAIEARVLSYLARETWRVNVFAKNGDIYCASASKMFHVPVEKHGVNTHLRQKGKIAELALGYGGSVGALTAMGALDMGLTEDDLKPLVDAWRSANSNIVQFWWDVDKAVKAAVLQREVRFIGNIKFECRGGLLIITLPSGRALHYVKPKEGINKFGETSITYEGLDGVTKKWNRIESYGPKFVENLVQAISRDILMYALSTLNHCAIVAHVHDEIIIDIKNNVSLEAICEQMSRTPPWMSGLKLNCAGYSGNYYFKD